VNNPNAVPAFLPDPARVAADQRILVASIAIVFVAIAVEMTEAGHSLGNPLRYALDVATLVVSIAGVARLASALRMPVVVRVVSIALLFVPLANLVVLGYFSAQATKALNAAGWKVGFLGATRP
jgi:hypothetical protein